MNHLCPSPHPLHQRATHRRHLILACGIALLATPAFAVIETWDGGGGNDNISTAANWVDNTAPLSSLADTVLYFEGNTRLAPNFDAPFAAQGILFDTLSSAFTFSGSQVTADLIENASGKTQTFNNPVLIPFMPASPAIFSGAGSTTVFNETVTVPAGHRLDLVANPGALSFKNFGGTGLVAKVFGGGTVSYAPSLPQQIKLTIAEGNVSTVADGSPDVFQAPGSITLSDEPGVAHGTLTLNEDCVLESVSLSRSAGAVLAIANGKALSLLNGASVAVTGSFTHSSTATITVSGSDFIASSSMTLRGGQVTVDFGGQLSSGSFMDVGSGGNGALLVDRTASVSSGALSYFGASGGQATVTFQNNAVGSFSGVSLGVGSIAGTAGIATVRSGADVTIAGALSLATSSAPVPAALTITDPGTTVVQTGNFPTTLGAASASSATIFVNNGAAYTTSTGAFTLNPTGTLNINGGIVDINGGIVDINGGIVDIKGPITDNGGNVYFSGGELKIVSNLSIGAGGLLGDGDVTLTASHKLTTTGAMTIAAGRTLALNATTLRTGAIVNNGTLSIPAASALIYGSAGIVGSGRILTGAGANANFLNNIVHNGAEIFTGAGGTTKCYADVSGAGHFTGAGGVFILGGNFRPGNSAAAVSFGGNLTLSAATLTMELGGTAEGTQHDSLHVTGALSVNGVLQVVLINGYTPQAGHSFDLFDAASITNAFAPLTLPALGAGLRWNTSLLYTAGTISVTDQDIADWRQGRFGSSNNSGNGADDADPDKDGLQNLLEYALDLNPNVPGAGGLPTPGTTTSDGQKYLTLTFTRPLDRADITYRVEVGATPATLVPGSTYSSTGDIPNTAATTQVSRSVAGNRETIVVRDNTPMTGETTRLMRLKVSNP